MRLLSVVGARPQFVKAAVLGEALARRGVTDVLVHTGQHYDAAMSEVFFRELRIRKPAYELNVGSAGHAAQSAEMMRRLEPIVQAEAPDAVLVYGDTNSTLAGTLVPAKLGVPVVHVEAGLRSFNRSMPEEINRIVADHLATLLFAPNLRVAQQLAAEGICEGVYVVGDLMVDLVKRVARGLPERPAVLDRFGVVPYAYGIATIHRAANTDDAQTFARLIAGLRATGMPIVFPVHPRTRELALAYGVGDGDNIVASPPLPYGETIALIARAQTVFTDSGGMQKEAYALQRPCVTLREETEWIETLEDGWNVLAGSDPDKIQGAARRFTSTRHVDHYGDGRAAERIAHVLCNRADESEVLKVHSA